MDIPPSNRLSFELMNESDADLLFQLDQDPDVMRYINGGRVTSMEDIQQRFIPRLKSYLNPKQGWGLWKVIVTDSKEYIGWILIRPMHFFSEQLERDNLEIGWRFFKSSWGKGYATEAATAIVDAFIDASHCGTISKISKISAIAMPDNKASIAVMKKLSLTYLKTATHKDPMGDEEVVYYQRLLN